MNIDKIIRQIFLKIIILYQFFLSPFLGKKCKFYPSCSEYAIDAFKKYDLLTGSFLTLRRIIFCHPWSLGGYKIVPNIFSIKRYLIIRLFSIKNKLY